MLLERRTSTGSACLQAGPRRFRRKATQKQNKTTAVIKGNVEKANNKSKITSHFEQIMCSTFSAAHRSLGPELFWADIPSQPLLVLAGGERRSVWTKRSRAHGVRARKLARVFWWGARAALAAPPGLRPDEQSSCSLVGGTTRTRPSAAPSCYSRSNAGEKVTLKDHPFNSEAGAPDLTGSGLEQMSHSKNRSQSR